ncbi:glycosyltransferase family 2 protein [Aeromonas media]|uniref:glycosyltransferase family 2 protein n=1 Tax=Aeromonas media TaxID=651 RepID=UPI003D23E453
MKFSAAINCYNEEEYIELSIKSIYNYVNEIVIIDNCSTDDTVKIIREFITVEDLDRKIIFIPLNEPMQLAAARNLCMSKATGDWIIKWDGDFIAYEDDCSSGRTQSIKRLFDKIRGMGQEYDAFLLYSLNISGDFFHYDKRRKYLGLNGDSLIVRKGHIEYVVSNYPDTGILKKPDGSKARVCYLNNPECDPMYFLHIFGAKPIKYHLYRAFMSKYQIWISNNENIDFWTWLEEKEKKNIDNALEYTKRQHLSNLEPHTFEIPSMLKNSILLARYTIEYNGQSIENRTEKTSEEYRLYADYDFDQYLCCANIDYFLKENKHNIYRVISNGKLIQDINTKYCAGEGANSKEEFIEKLKNSIENLKISFKDPIIFANLIYIYPEKYLNKHDFAKCINNLNNLNITLIFSRNIVRRIALQNIDNLTVCNEHLALILSLSASIEAHSPYKEKILIEKILNKNIYFSQKIKNLLSQRINKIQYLYPLKKCNTNNGLRLLILVGGQLNNYTSAMSTWKEYFNGCERVDCVISTWNNLGFQEFSKIHKDNDLDKFFDKNIINAYNQQEISLSKLEDLYNKSYSQLELDDNDIKSIEALLDWTSDLKIKIHSKKHDDFQGMNNAEEYYYHHKYFSSLQIDLDQYDLIVKIRPDLKFHSLNNNIHNELHKISNKVVLVDGDGYFLAPWGFGTGDQLLAFSPSNFDKILNSDFNEYDVGELCKRFGKPKLSIHTSLAFQFWAHGLSCGTFKKYTRQGLAVREKISIR